MHVLQKGLVIHVHCDHILYVSSQDIWRLYDAQYHAVTMAKAS